ncbi:MAG: hypothetical protein V4580_18865, partial [Bacteroidota bacterium]
MYQAVSFETTWGKWTVTKDSMMGLYTWDGIQLLPSIYQFIEPHYDMNNEFIVISKDNKNFGLTTIKGVKILELKYPRILDFRKNLLHVSLIAKNNTPRKMILDTAQNHSG